MRAKYKLGVFVKVATPDCPPAYGAVEAVTLTTAGVEYRVTGIEDVVPEADIAVSYRESKPRKEKAVKTAKGSKKGKEAQTSAAA